jgi:membrane fusion protein, multidrug efflux system
VNATRIGLILMVLAPLVLWGCPARPAPGGAAPAGGPPGAVQPSAQPPVPVLVTTAKLGSIDRTVRSVGTVRAVESVTLTTEVAGVVQEIGFAESGLVRKGDVLVELDADIARAQLDSATAELERAQRQVARLEAALEQRAVSVADLDDARTLVARAKAEHDLARLRFEQHTLKAPFSGRAGMRMVSPGAYLRPGDPVTTLITIDPIEIEFTIPEVFLADVKTGQSVTATSAAYPGRRFEATVDVVGSSVDPGTRSIPVLAEMVNADGALRPGMFVEVALVREKIDNALLVPEQALQLISTRAELFVVEDGTARRRTVVVGERRAGIAQIVSGLEPGATVITQGLQRIREGSKVEATPDPAMNAEGAAR